jgi:hypothetical protein
MSETQDYVVRTEGMFNSYGLGKVIAKNITLFEAGKYNLTLEQLQKEIAKLSKARIR